MFGVQGVKRVWGKMYTVMPRPSGAAAAFRRSDLSVVTRLKPRRLANKERATGARSFLASPPVLSDARGHST